MNRNTASSAVALFVLLPLGFAQEPRLGERDLLKGLDTLNLDPNGKPGEAQDGLPPPKRDKSQGQTEITSNDAEFNNKTHIAIFTGDVVVKNPEFNVNCDKLTAYLKHADKPPAGDKPKAATPAPTPAAPDAKPKSGGLDRALAEMANGGKVLITQDKKEADGTTTHSVGRSDRALYNAVTGDVTLTGWPEVKQGINSGVAVDESSVIIMTRDGKMRTIGRVKFLIQDSGSEKPARSGTQ